MLAVFSLKSGSLIGFYWAMSWSVLATSVSFFVSALATVAMFDHWRRSQFVLWKLMLLVSAIFAFFCYKRQLASVGDALLETQPEHARKATIEPKGTGKP
jgi:hypothetical protein